MITPGEIRLASVERTVKRRKRRFTLCHSSTELTAENSPQPLTLMPSGFFRKKSLGEILADVPTAQGGLKRVLGVKELTTFGVAAIVGAGIFSTVGTAAASSGPAVVLLFVFVAVACAFAAWCYAAFASLVPVAGSVYTYSYLVFGEVIAWLLGWTLVLSYGIGNVAIAVAWSDYLSVFLEGFGVQVPAYFSMDYLSARNGNLAFEQLSRESQSIPGHLQEARSAWISAPHLFGFRLIGDLPALFIVLFTTVLLYVGVRESSIAGKIMVGIKVFIIVMFLVAGVFYVQPANWTPFAPNGFAGITGGVPAVFFAYIGFDAISTMAEESRDPQRDIPRLIFLAVLVMLLVLSFRRNYSLIPVLGVLASLYLMTELSLGNWIGFGLWLLGGLIVYFGYGYRNSPLSRRAPDNSPTQR